MLIKVTPCNFPPISFRIPWIDARCVSQGTENVHKWRKLNLETCAAVAHCVQPKADERSLGRSKCQFSRGTGCRHVLPFFPARINKVHEPRLNESPRLLLHMCIHRLQLWCFRSTRARLATNLGPWREEGFFFVSNGLTTAAVWFCNEQHVQLMLTTTDH